MKEILEKEAFEMIEKGFNAVSFDNSYSCSDYYRLVQIVVLFKDKSKDILNCDISDLYFKKIGKKPDFSSPIKFEDKSDLSCDNVYFYVYN